MGNCRPLFATCFCLLWPARVFGVLGFEVQAVWVWGFGVLGLGFWVQAVRQFEVLGLGLVVNREDLQGALGSRLFGT